MLKPIFTEKSINMAKNGKYSFWVEPNDNKMGLKSEIAKIFGVHVTSIKTIKKAGEKGRTARGKKFNKLASKKAIVTVKDGEKIDIFEESKK
ncbi:MAG TPA: 50S ribosomal protein L23 [Patescibacteria group bacterium]|nr:50S ribosomal protein L23 [Patescibacteria group bacterium]